MGDIGGRSTCHDLLARQFSLGHHMTNFNVVNLRYSAPVLDAGNVHAVACQSHLIIHQPYSSSVTYSLSATIRFKLPIGSRIVCTRTLARAGNLLGTQSWYPCWPARAFQPMPWEAFQWFLIGCKQLYRFCVMSNLSFFCVLSFSFSRQGSPERKWRWVILKLHYISNFLDGHNSYIENCKPELMTTCKKISMTKHISNRYRIQKENLEGKENF